MAKRLIGRVAFSVYGSAIVENARDIALSGEWLKAMAVLKDNIEGFTLDQAMEVLSGKMTLTGNSSENNIFMAEDHDSEDYCREMKEVYICDLFYTCGQLYKYERRVDDQEFIEMMARYNYKYDSGFTHEERLQAVERYIGQGKEKVFMINSNEFVIALPVDPNAYPMWYKREEYHNSVFSFYNEYFGIEQPKEIKVEKSIVEKTEELKKRNEENRDYVQEMVNKSNREYLLETAKSYGFEDIETFSKDMMEKVKSACLERNVEWEMITLDNGEEVNVPKQLVLGYLSRDWKHWHPVCDSGIKMYNDSAWHSDLWLAMGNEMSEKAYDHNVKETNTFYDAIEYFRGLKLNDLGDFSVLNEIKIDKFSGRVVFEGEKNIKDTDILVLPNAGLKYEALAKKAGMVICEMGGQLSHLVMVGKEEMFPVVVMKDALRKLKGQSDIEVDFANRKINGKYRYC